MDACELIDVNKLEANLMYMLVGYVYVQVKVNALNSILLQYYYLLYKLNIIM